MFPLESKYVGDTKIFVSLDSIIQQLISSEFILSEVNSGVNTDGYYSILGFSSGSAVKNLPTNAEDIKDVVGSLGWEDPVEKGIATHSSILAWRIPRTEEPGGPQSTQLQRAGHDWSNLAHTQH